MTLNDSRWTAGQWNTAFYTIPDTLLPGQSVSVDITLLVGNITGPTVNLAEIASHCCHPDIDSTPDKMAENDGNVVDNEINNGGGDQDDHDPAGIDIIPAQLPNTGQTIVQMPTFNTTLALIALTFIAVIFVFVLPTAADHDTEFYE